MPGIALDREDIGVAAGAQLPVWAGPLWKRYQAASVSTAAFHTEEGDCLSLSVRTL